MRAKSSKQRCPALCLVVARLKIRKRLILKKLLPPPASFQHFRFRVCFRFQPLSSKCFRFHKNLTASTSLYTFQQFKLPITSLELNILFNRLRTFSPKDYLRGSLGKSHQNADYLSTQSIKR